MDSTKDLNELNLSFLISLSRDELINIVQTYDKLQTKQIYLQILNKIENTIALGNIAEFKKLSNLIDCITNIKSCEILREFYENSAHTLKNTNLIILSCKHNRIEILQYVFNENNQILKQLTFNPETNSPKFKDDSNHNAFYYAIRSGNLELLEALINKWPGDYFTTNFEELDELLSSAYEELNLKNIVLTEDIIVFVNNKLINLRFYSNGENSNVDDPLNNIKERINLIIDNIHLLNDYHKGEIDVRFLHVAKFIVQNIHILKRQLKSTYIRLPWEEIEFYLIAFISCHQIKQEIIFFYQSILDEKKLLKYLDYFAKYLQKEKDYLDGNDNKSKLNQLPNLSREIVIAKITQNYPEFKDLYDDYQEIVDIHSLFKINHYIKLALLADAKERAGQLVITRMLQVMGEFFKNTLESPKLSTCTSELLLQSLPKGTRKIITDLRNSLSHVHSLPKRLEIEKNANANFFNGVQNDSKIIADVITDIFYQKKMSMIRASLAKLCSNDDINEMKRIINLLKNSKIDMTPTKFVCSEIDRLDGLIKELRNCVENPKSNVIKIFDDIKITIELDKNKIENSDKNVFEVLVGIKSLDVFIKHNTDVKGLKFRAGLILRNMTPTIEITNLKEIIEKLHTILVLVENDDQGKMITLYWKIVFLIEQTFGNIKCINELRDILKSKKPSKKVTNSYKINREEYREQFKLKLSELKSTLNEKQTFKNNKQLQATIEMLLLDCLSIMGDAENNLENNHFFLDGNTPLLIGKCLRNHLAHYNAIVDILLYDPTISIVLNVEKLTTDKNLLECKRKIGKIVVDDPCKLKEKFVQHLKIIKNQELLFTTLKEGNYEKVYECIKNGADIYARNIDNLTTLNLATIGSNIDIVKFLIGENVKGENLLHVAAENGHKKLVHFFINELQLDVNNIDHEEKTPLHYAAINGHLDIIKILLENKAYVNCVDYKGLSPLFYAATLNHINIVTYLFDKTDLKEVYSGNNLLHAVAEYGYFELANILLNKNVNVNGKNERHWTPLHAAAYNGHLEIVEIFLKKGAHVNDKVVNGCTALYYAVENGNENIVKLLIEHGANINVFERTKNSTAIHAACYNGNEEIVKILLKNKADPFATNKNGLTPLHLAAREGHLTIVQILLKCKGIDVNAADKNQFPPLYYAIENGHEDIVELLIKNNANIKNINSVALHLAAGKGSKNIVDMLLKCNCNVNARDAHNNTPMHYAIRNNSKEIVETLIRYKSDINASKDLMMTPLHVAASFGSHISAELLIEHGAKINCINIDQNTPLHLAVYHNDKQIVNLLLKNGADINAKNINRQTPLDVGLKLNYTEIVNILFENNANIYDDSLITAVKHNNKDMVKTLISKGVDDNIQNNTCLTFSILTGHREMIDILLENTDCVNANLADDSTLLHTAVANNDKKTVETLLEKKTNINALDTNKYTPLHYCAKYGSQEIAKILIKNGANVTLKDNENRTAFELAVSYDRLEIVKMLLEKNKINLNAKGNDDFTVLHIASQAGNTKMVEYLVNKGADINAKNYACSKPVHIAAREGFLQVVEFFLDNGNSINEYGVNNQTILHYAAMAGKLQIVKLLLSKNADINAQDAQGLSPLHLAAYLNHKETVEYLLTNGAYFNIADKNGRNPIDYSKNQQILNLFISIKHLFNYVKCNDILKVENCIKTGALVNVKNVANETPLIYAVWKGYHKIVDLLLQNKCDPNISAKNGFTALHYAAKFSHLPIVKTLLLNKAIFNITSDNGKTPQDVSTNAPITNLFQLINKAFNMIAEGNTNIINELNQMDIETVKIVMNAYNTEKKTLIVVAIHNNFPQIDKLKYILRNGIPDQIEEALKLSSMGFDDKALNLLNAIYENRKSLLGPDNPILLDIKTHIGLILYKQGKYNEALKLYNELFEKQTKILGAINKDTLVTRSSIALTLYRLNKDDEAYRIYQEIYPKLVELLGPEDDTTMNTEFEMASVLCSLGKYDEALELNKKFYKFCMEKRGSKDPNTIRAQNNIALALSYQGKIDKALKIYREVHQNKKEVFGPYHVDTLRTMGAILELLTRQKKYHEALKTQEELIAIQKQYLGSKHPETLNTQYHMACTLFSQCKYTRSLTLFKECRRDRKKVFGPEDPVIQNIVYYIEMINKIQQIKGTNDTEIFNSLQTNMNNAVVKNDIKTVQHLLEYNFDMNERDSEGRTTLHYAVSSRSLEIIHLLLKHGVNATRITNKGNTVLHIAASKGCEDIVTVLLKHVKQTDNDEFDNFINWKTSKGGTTALHVAAKNGFDKIVKILLEHGAIHNCVDNEKKTPLEISTNKNVIHLLETCRK